VTRVALTCGLQPGLQTIYACGVGQCGFQTRAVAFTRTRSGLKPPCKRGLNLFLYTPGLNNAGDHDACNNILLACATGQCLHNWPVPAQLARACVTGECGQGELHYQGIQQPNCTWGPKEFNSPTPLREEKAWE
jgi:hypothetical protein